MFIKILWGCLVRW